MRQLIIGISILLLMTLGGISLSSVTAADDPTSQTAGDKQTNSQVAQETVGIVPIDKNTSVIIAVAIMWLFLPINTLTYYWFRRNRRKFEVERIFEVLSNDPQIFPDTEEAFRYA